MCDSRSRTRLRWRPRDLSKHLKTLASAGILNSTTGPHGGFRLDRSPDSISILDVVTAIEGREDAFRCQQILRHGLDGRDDVDYRTTCAISQAMSSAELTWRQELAGRTIADICRAVESRQPTARRRTRDQLLRRRP